MVGTSQSSNVHVVTHMLTLRPVSGSSASLILLDALACSEHLEARQAFLEEQGVQFEQSNASPRVSLVLPAKQN